MNDEELERRLRRFRVAGPPEGLRGRVFAAVEQRPASQARLGGWLAAVAALLLVTLASQWSSQRLITGVDVPVEDQSARFADAIATGMGSTEDAQLAVSRIVAESLTRRLDPPSPASGQELQAP